VTLFSKAHHLNKFDKDKAIGVGKKGKTMKTSPFAYFAGILLFNYTLALISFSTRIYLGLQ
jgi:hypothetical protein